MRLFVDLMSVECLFSRTLLTGGAGQRGHPVPGRRGGRHQAGRGLHSLTSQLNLSRFDQ